MTEPTTSTAGCCGRPAADCDCDTRPASNDRAHGLVDLTIYADDLRPVVHVIGDQHLSELSPDGARRKARELVRAARAVELADHRAAKPTQAPDEAAADGDGGARTALRR